MYLRKVFNINIKNYKNLCINYNCNMCYSYLFILKKTLI